MTPEWVDYTGAISAAVAAVGAIVALIFAIKAGRDLTHDRSDTFELQVLRDLYEIVSQGQYIKPHLRAFLRGSFPALAEYYEVGSMLMFEATQGTHIKPGYASENEYMAWRGEELDRMLQAAKAELLGAVYQRTGRSGR